MSFKKTKEVAKHLGNIESAKEFFSSLKDTEEGKYDDKSDRWKESEKGEQKQQDISDLESAVSDLESGFDSLENLFEE